jgi:hypothetical protein
MKKGLAISSVAQRNSIIVGWRGKYENAVAITSFGVASLSCSSRSEASNSRPVLHSVVAKISYD